MLKLPRDAPGSDACSRSGLPLLAICPNRHRRLIPFRLLKTHHADTTPLYGRPFLCRACGSREVTLFAIENQVELAEVRRDIPLAKGPVEPHTSHRPVDPDADLP